MAEALRFSGARSATKGMRIWGVTETAPTMKESASKTMRLSVTASPMVIVVDKMTVARMSGLRRTRSPRGDINKRPAAYLMRVS